MKSEKIRTYGSRGRIDALQSANEVLGRFADRQEHHEKNRVLQIVQELYGTTGLGSQPRSSHCVRIIHQIYGLVRDGKPMPRLFINSQVCWRQVASHMGARYHLWSADEVDSLIKQHYAEFWATYRSFPFAKMRADMARIAILHRYGGMYADLDVFPIADTFAQADLAVQKVFGHALNRVKTKRNYRVCKKRSH